MTRLHLVDDVDRPVAASRQMPIDEALLEAVAVGEPPTLRLYTWAAPTLSLGRFQSRDDIDLSACERHGVEVIQRPSGGRAILHGSDLTYAIAMRRPGETVRATYCHLARGVLEGLSRLDLTATITDRVGADHAARTPAACFTGAGGIDLAVGGRKLCGSAMVRRGDAVLQHGSLLLHRLPIDESDLLMGIDRESLRSATVTLEELGRPTDPVKVSVALVDGFRAALDLDVDLDLDLDDRSRG